eukprot:m.71889 g.71889  ORF g.71889 m.71889 type:complete len:145 (+) comp20197_c0_seq2:93-527(+)
MASIFVVVVPVITELFYRYSNKLSKGFNFRHADYYRENGTLYRDLYKVYGLRTIFLVGGVAGRFSFVPLIITFGSGVGLLGVATVLADLMVTKVLSRKEFYKAKKFEFVDEDRDYHVFKQGYNENSNGNGYTDTEPLNRTDIDV